ncbi:MAG: TPR repeat protein [Gammaproteobacteria bacterium]
MSKQSKKRHLNSLQPGSELHWYEIREILGQGGFGITYLADDKNLAHEVAIKEYMPIDLAARAPDGSVEALSQDHLKRYLWGLERFIEEARTLGLFNHPNIVRVRNVFQTNNTAYMVMDYELGESLQDILNRRKILDEDDIGTVIFPIIDGMKQVHAHGFIHRDIKPANIFIRVDGDPVLLDFGSARQALSGQDQSLTSIFSKGYAPIEQYSTEDEQQGAWTDIYAFGATMYRAVAGVPPSDAINRSSALSLASRDTYVSAVEIGAGRYSSTLLEAIDAAMQFKHQDRPQTISEWQTTFIAARSAAPAAQPVPLIKEILDPLTEKIRAAEAGDVSAQSALAFIYAKGEGTEINDDEAFNWFTKAALQGDAVSQFNLGVMYAKGRSVSQDYHLAFEWYKKAAEQGDINSQATIAMMYMKGIGSEKDQKAAFDWTLRAAKRGHLNSIFNLGEFYANGFAVEKNLIESFRWNKKAALKGHINAQLNLGYMYGKGEGVERDDTEAYHWYRKAAESGHPNAQFNLGVIYAKGRGVASNVEEAKIWYKLADEQGVEQAGRALARLNK